MDDNLKDRPDLIAELAVLRGACQYALDYLDMPNNDFSVKYRSEDAKFHGPSVISQLREALNPPPPQAREGREG